jgi:hypothetical protein
MKSSINIATFVRSRHGEGLKPARYLRKASAELRFKSPPDSHESGNESIGRTSARHYDSSSAPDLEVICLRGRGEAKSANAESKDAKINFDGSRA